MKTECKLENIDSEDIQDILVKVETSFNLKFINSEFAHITSFGKLCDHIANKIQLSNSDDCTTQQAFYKLRDAISSTLHIDYKIISTDFPLSDLLPRQSRRLMTRRFEKYLGFKLNILRPPHWVTWTLVLLLFSSLIALFFTWQIGISGLLFSIAGLRLAIETGNVLNLQTVGQVAQKMARENYLKSRRNPNTCNKKEVEKLLIDLFASDLDLSKSKLTRDAKFS